MCLAQGPQSSDTGEAGTPGPSVSSQAHYHYATALPFFDDFWLYIYSLFRLVDLSLDEYEELQRAAQERADIVAKYDKVMYINP